MTREEIEEKIAEIEEMLDNCNPETGVLYVIIRRQEASWKQQLIELKAELEKLDNN